MNKKRVALALAAALSVNTLMVTVGQVGQQAVVAHAVDGKLTNQDDINKLNGLKIKTLKSELTTNASGETVVNFPELKDSIKSLNVKSFTHTPFAERADIETVATVTHKVEGQTLNLGKLTTPGIYTGEVEVTLGDGSKESYTLTLRKTPVDTLSYDVQVEVGRLEIKNLTFSNGSEDITTKIIKNPVNEGNLELVSPNGKVVNAKLEKGDYEFNLLDLVDGGKIKEGDEFTLRVKYGKNNEYTLESKILLTKQDKPVIKRANLTNEKDFLSSSLSGNIKEDYFDSSTVTANVQVTNSNVTVEGKNVLTYEQTKNNDKLGGVTLSVTTSGLNVNLNNDTISVAPLDSTSLQDNYLNGVMYSYGSSGSGPNKSGVIGDYTFKIDGQTVTYFDAMNGMNVQVSTGSAGKSYLNISDANGQGLKEQIEGKISVNLDFSNKLEHGYQSVVGTFGVNAEEDLNKIESENQKIKDMTNTAMAVPGAKDDTKSSEDDIKVSLIIAADTLDGISNGAKFTRTSESEGEFELPANEINRKAELTVEDATVTKEERDGKLIYSIKFNGNIPSSFNWNLKYGDKTLTNTVETGALEVLNADNARVENLPNINNQFKVNANFNLKFPKETTTKFGIDDVDSDRVTFEQFGKGPHTLKLTATSGKYQGTYTAGVVVEQQSFVIGLKEKPNASTSNSATLIVKGTNVDKDALNNVTKATLQYKEKNSNTWKNDADINLKTLQSQKEFDLTKAHLNPNTEYDFRIAYEVKTNDNKTNTLYTNVVTIKTLTSTSSNSGNSTITGNGGSSTSGTSTGNITVNVTNNNLTVNGSNIGVRIPSSIKYDSNKTPVVVGVKYKDNNGKTISEVNSQFKNVVARFNGDNVELEGLVPGKEYVEISVDYTDNNGKVKTIILRNPKFDSNVENDKYLANIYNVVFSRPADETGYQFHLNNLKGKNVSLREFVLNMLSEKEFIEAYNTTEKKIEALYNAIVNRNSDENGRKFWVEEYRKVLSVYGSESTALKAIAERMVNENELKTLAEKLNFRW